jgi:uncharacterized protein involved in exopolysaccharide biosynthesis
MNSNITDTKEDITILDIFNIFYTHKVLIILLGLAGLLLGILISYIIKPIYTSEVLMVSQLENQSSQASGLAGLAGLTGISFGNDSSNKEAVKAMAILKSRTFRLHVVENEDLKPFLFPERWDIENNKWYEAEPSDLSAASKLNRLIKIKTSEKGLIQFTISSYSPEFSSFLSNKIIYLINNYLRSQVIEEAEESIALLKDELKTTKFAAIEEKIYSQIEGHTQSKTLANVRQEYAFKVIDKAIEQTSPSWPIKMQIQLMGVVSGLLLGLILSLFFGFFRKTA